MGKNKLARWTELGTFINVIQPETADLLIGDHRIKGNWRREIFMNDNPVVIELGCGKGEYTTGLAEMFPGRNYIGVDIKGARMWRGAKTANERKLPNAAFLRTRIEFINSFFSEDEVDEIWLTFPDPHPGKKNSNKRLTCPWFIRSYRRFLKNNGIIHLKTDNEELYNYTRKLVTKNQLALIFETNNLYSEEFSAMVNDSQERDPGISESLSGNILSIRTHYENIFIKEGLKIHYLGFRLDKEKIISDVR